MIKYLLILLIILCTYYYFFHNSNPEEFATVKKLSKKNINKSGSTKLKTSKGKTSKLKTSKKSIKKKLEAPIKYSNNQNKISKATSLQQINSLLSKDGIDSKVFDYKTMTDIDLAKFSAIKLITLKNILKGASNLSNTLNSLLGLDLNDNSFKIILTNANIQESKQLNMLNNFITELKQILQITIAKEPSLDDVPKNIISNARKVFPIGTALDICVASTNMLKNLRGKRIIDFEEYMLYQKQINDKCKERATKIIPKGEINLSKIKNLNQVPIDKKVGLPVIKSKFKNYKAYVKSKTKAKGETEDIIKSDNMSHNLMFSIYGS